jgi:hypothetical protein
MHNYKRGALLFGGVFLFVIFSIGVLAENSTDILEGVSEEYGSVELASGGITPGSPFYFIDEFFDRFQDDLNVREEKLAEFLELKKRGDERAAKVALENYNRYVNKLEKEISPEKRDDARRSAAAIRNALGDVEEDEDVKEILESEERLVTAVEIAGKIKSLCEDLAKLDPAAYYETCRAGDDGPEWKKKLDDRLTGDQKKIAKNFVRVMKQCFETSGQECNCEEIPFPDFAEACSKAAPLATACDVEGDEAACEKLDSLEMPELPPYLQEIFEEVDEEMVDAKYKMHMPKECVKEGITNPKECGKLMITKYAPPECKDALLEADVQNEWEARKICDEIMMNIHAPECAEEGITNPKECEEFMYDIGNRPEECQKNGIHDLRDCKRFLEEGSNFRKGPRLDCMSVEDPMKRLECFEGAIGDFKDFKEMRKEIKEKEKQCAEECENEGGAWDFSGGECKCRFFEEGEFGEQKYREGEERDYRKFDEKRFRMNERRGFMPGEDNESLRDHEREFEDDYGEKFEEDFSEGDVLQEETNAEEDQIDSEPSTESEPSDTETSDSTTDFSITGNTFLDYYFG